MSNKQWLYKKSSEYRWWNRELIEGYWNLPYFRSPSNYKWMLRAADFINDLNKEGYKIKPISKQVLSNYDSWREIQVTAYSERRCWKRNSKNKKQWKVHCGVEQG